MLVEGLPSSTIISPFFRLISKAFPTSPELSYAPYPENAIYEGGVGGLYTSYLLSSRLTERPLGCLALSSRGTYLFKQRNNNCK